MLVIQAGLLVPPSHDGEPDGCIAGWGKVKLGRTVCNRNSDLQSDQQGRNGDCVER
jgi:hypothetical protein